MFESLRDISSENVAQKKEKKKMSVIELRKILKLKNIYIPNGAKKDVLINLAENSDKVSLNV